MTSPPLWAMTPAAQAVAMEWYECGYLDGAAAERERVEQEWCPPASWADGVRALKRMGLRGPFADVLDRRGQHDAAERHRAMLKDRGIA